jgi:hypothetical protein
MTHACLEAFKTLNLRLISTACLTLPEVSSDAIFTLATYASTLGIPIIMLQDQGGGLQPISYSMRKLNPAERNKTYSAFDLDALPAYEAAKHWRCCLEGCSKFLIVMYYDTLRHLLTQSYNKLRKRQARYMLDLQPFVGTMILAYYKREP